jgi:hypothetical protein
MAGKEVGSCSYQPLNPVRLLKTLPQQLSASSRTVNHDPKRHLGDDRGFPFVRLTWLASSEYNVAALSTIFACGRPALVLKLEDFRA